VTGAVKSLAAALLPDPLLTRIRAIRARRHSHMLNAQWGLRALSERITREIGFRVLAGPFAGLTLPDEAVAEHLAPYLSGNYEREIQHIWSRVGAPVPLVVNIGSKFGYYAVGLSRMLKCPAVAVDPDSWARRMTRATAQLNPGSDVSLRARVTREWLAEREPGTLVVIDCDGCEVALLLPSLPRGLAACTLVIEVHEDQACGSGGALAAELGRTHAIEEIPSDATPGPLPPQLEFLDEASRTLATKEFRPHQSWLVCTPRRSR
jgi:hypothetical protein